MDRKLLAAFSHVAKVCVAIFTAMPGIVVADTVTVSPDGLGDYTTIQEAVDDLPNSGPRVVVVRAGTYYESVEFWRTNAQASSEADRIVLMADPLAPAGSVMIVPGGTGEEEQEEDDDDDGEEDGGGQEDNSQNEHAFKLAQSKYVTIKGFTVTGASRSAILLRGGYNSNTNIIVEGNDVYDNGLQCENCAAVEIKHGNDRTWVVNNLIRHNGRSGLGVGHDDGDDQVSGLRTYVINNTFFANGWNGIRISGLEEVYLVNNLVVGNGSAPSPPVAAGQRWGLKAGADDGDEDDDGDDRWSRCLPAVRTAVAPEAGRSYGEHANHSGERRRFHRGRRPRRNRPRTQAHAARVGDLYQAEHRNHRRPLGQPATGGTREHTTRTRRDVGSRRKPAL